MIEEKLNQFPKEIKEMFLQLEELVYEACPTANEIIWAGLPSYYSDSNHVVRLIAFKNHINIEAQALICFKTELKDYKFTPKNMLQIYVGETIPKNILLDAFHQTFICE